MFDVRCLLKLVIVVCGVVFVVCFVVLFVVCRLLALSLRVVHRLLCVAAV